MVNILSLKRQYKNFVKGIKNLIDWFPIIWKDRDYDYCFFYKMMEHKMKNMGNDFIECGIVDMKEEGKGLINCCSAINRLVDGNYIMDDYNKLDEKYGFMRVTSTKEVSDTGEIRYKCDFIHEKIKTKEDQEAYYNDIRSLSEKEDKLMDDDIKFITDFINENSKKWWW